MTVAPTKLGGPLSLCLWLAASFGCGDDAGSDDADAGPAADTTPPPAAPADAGANAGDAASDGAEAGTGDASVDPLDAGHPPIDADVGDAGEPELPTTLEETGLYVTGSTDQLAPGVVEYSPAYALWSDGAEKRRWLKIPDGAQIDSSDMAYWQFPVGTKAWKEFRKDGKRLETRLLWKTARGWYRMAFVWNEDETGATAAPDGIPDVRGTDHDVPERGACGECHDGLPDRLLGVGAIQLSGNRAGLTLDQLIADNRLSDPPAADFQLPDAPGWNALGYLHANCGNCHNPRGEAYDRLDLDLFLRPDRTTTVVDTPSFQTTVGVELSDTEGPTYRIERGSADRSGLIFRMSMRGSDQAMPPVGSEVPDDAGIRILSDWIDSL